MIGTHILYIRINMGDNIFIDDIIKDFINVQII